MAENSKIEWTDNTFNPWIGCAKVSEGCKNCYAEMQNKYRKWAEWGPHGTRIRTSESYWRKPLSWNRQAMQAGIRTKVFCASLADVFEDRDELIPWRIELFRLILDTPHLDWLILTKRPEYAVEMMIDEGWDNLWLGTSVENQKQADLRIPELLRIPAAKHFLSMEPLLGPVDLIGKDNQTSALHPYEDDPKIDGVIVGGESGPKARPMHPDWVRDIRGQCNEAGVPFFFKQWGEWDPMIPDPGGLILKDYNNAEIIENDGQLMARIGKKKAGRTLDGREWSEMPAP